MQTILTYSAFAGVVFNMITLLVAVFGRNLIRHRNVLIAGYAYGCVLAFFADYSREGNVLGFAIIWFGRVLNLVIACAAMYYGWTLFGVAVMYLLATSFIVDIIRLFNKAWADHCVRDGFKTLSSRI